MKLGADVAAALVAVLHLGFLVLEMFFWTKPLGLKVFRQSREKAEASAALAANQGLYNGFLVAGLAWSLMHPAPEIGLQLRFFFLACVIVAGAYGAATVNMRIFVVQAGPAILALVLALLQ